MKKLFNVLGIILTIILTPSCEEKTAAPPTLSTTTVTKVTTTTAVSGGTITADGGARIIARGVCWNTSDNPTIENNKTSENSDLLSFTSNITQLSPNTSYYVRAYATNSAGTGYGKSVSFKTPGDKPVSNAFNASNTTINSATLTGSVNPNFLSTTVTFEYGVTTSYGSTAVALGSPVPGDSDENVTVKADLSGLTPGTTYHFRIKAENSLGTTYSSDLTFTTLGQVPTPDIQAASNLQAGTATLNGSVNPNYLSSTITFEWGTTRDYGNTITALQSPLTGNTSVSVSADLTELAPGTTYHSRIKAENSLGTTYSSDIAFTTLGKLPTVVTFEASDIQLNVFTFSGTVNPNYLLTTITCEWGTTTSYGNSFDILQNPFTGNTEQNFNVDLKGLSEGTTYYYRIKATNKLGTMYGDQQSVTTNLSDYDGNIYHTVNIGTQIWLVENLKVTHYSNGNSINYIDSNTLWDNITTGVFCYYFDNIIKSAEYGNLYNWYATVDVRGLCPTGWHVPTNSDWETIETYLGGPEVAGGKMKEAGSTHWAGSNTGATNSSGFTALPGGRRIGGGNPAYGNLGFDGFWWSSSEFDSSYSWNIDIYTTGAMSIRTHIYEKSGWGFSVRCLKDSKK